MSRAAAPWCALLCFAAACGSSESPPTPASCGSSDTSVCLCDDGQLGERACVDGGFGECDCPAPRPEGECRGDADCFDGRFCNGIERCRPGSADGDARGCVPADAPPSCDDGIECTSDRCDGELDRCVYTPPDADADGHLDASCTGAEGELLGDDCDDGDADRYPGNPERCDPEDFDHDEDCDDSTYGRRDVDGDSSIDARCCNGDNCGDDCDDGDIARRAQQPEFCDMVDNDCDGEIDEQAIPVPWYFDGDGDGFGSSSEGVGAPIESCMPVAERSLLSSDCNDVRADRHPAQLEICDLRDNDCDGTADESAGCPYPPFAIDPDAEPEPPLPTECPELAYLDADGDGAGDPGVTLTLDPLQPACGLMGGYVLDGRDCDDGEPLAHPGAAEQCDGFDNDCDGMSDEDPEASDSCDQGGGAAGCVAGSCMLRTSPTCGDGTIDAGEACDAGALDGKTCTDFGLLDGVLSCGPGCRFDTAACLSCGNGVVDDGEECDGDTLGDATCSSLGLVSGELSCDAGCRYDRSGCETCGNGVGDAGEACDGDDFGNQRCEDFGFVSGALSCTEGCAVDVSTCTGCGNGVIDGSEECDAQDFGDVGCDDLGFAGGAPTCTAQCTIDTGTCNGCGNGVVDTGAGEACDGALVPSDCAGQGFEDGELSCDQVCQFDTTGCFDYATLTLLFDGAGTVAAEPLGETCWDNCSQDVVEGSELTLTAAPLAGHSFVGWQGAAGCDTDTTCVLTVDADVTVTAEFAVVQANYAFITNADYNGVLGGRDGADAICQQAADAAGLPGTFWALVSDNSKVGEEGAADRFLAAGTGGFIRTDGQLFATSAADLFGNSHQYYPLDLDEFGGNRARVDVWTGAGTDYSPNTNCANWTTTGGHGTKGNAGYGGHRFASTITTNPCGRLAALTCLAVDSLVELSPPPLPTERRIFVTAGSYAPAPLGIEALDLICQNEADGAGLTPEGERFLAYVANPNGDAPDRFLAPGETRLTGPVFTRLDGVRIASNMDNFLTGQHLALINVEASGSIEPAGAWVWTGLLGDGADWDDRSCGGWLQTAWTSAFGSLEERSRNFRHNTTSCAASQRLYCAEQ